MLWAEDFVKSRASQIRQLLEKGFDVNVDIGIFSNVLALNHRQEFLSARGPVTRRET